MDQFLLLPVVVLREFYCIWEFFCILTTQKDKKQLFLFIFMEQLFVYSEWVSGFEHFFAVRTNESRRLYVFGLNVSLSIDLHLEVVSSAGQTLERVVVLVVLDVTADHHTPLWNELNYSFLSFYYISVSHGMIFKLHTINYTKNIWLDLYTVEPTLYGYDFWMGEYFFREGW